jgi:PTS system ascorbate-specific IIC component
VYIINFIVNQILGKPSILVGLVALLGLVLQRKPFHEVLSGTIKTIVGFLIIGIGAGTLLGVLNPMADLFKTGLNLVGVYPFNESAVAIALKDYGQLAVLIMAVSFVVNVILARFTRFKFIFLTGHIMLYTAVILALFLKVHTSLPFATMVLIGGVFEGIMNTLLPALCHPYMLKVTDGAPIAYGHSSNLVAWLGGFLGKLSGGDPKKSTENLNIPKSLSFIRDTTIGTGITMAIFYIAIVILAGTGNAAKLAGADNVFIWAIMQGIQFGAGVTVLLLGVRMLIAEIVPAFKGISDKLVPNAVPALDCPIVMPYAPNAWMIGFVVSYLIGLVFTIIMGITQAFPVVIIASVIPHFFDSGPAAVFGNATGGIRGAVVAAAASSIVVSIGAAFLVPLTGPLATSGTTWCCSDYVTIYSAFGFFLKLLGGM